MWSLSPGIHHLNHGSFGAVPITVQEARAELLRRWESATTVFVFDHYNDLVEAARRDVASFVGAPFEGFAFVRNATQGSASVVRSIEPWLGPGDEILTTTHAYNALRQTLEFSAARTGARVVAVEIPFPIDDPRRITETVVERVGPRTKLVAIDHISSPTGLVFPLGEIVARLEPAVPVLVDGAHGPGQVPLDLGRLGASWYTGNLHKWVCAPKGAGFLSTRADRIDETFPVVISHGWNTPMVGGESRYHALFDWVGTDDITPWLTAPQAISVIGGLDPGGWPGVMQRNREMALAARSILCEALGIDVPAPESMVGSMAAIPLPRGKGEVGRDLLAPLHGQLLAAGFETLVYPWPEWPEQVLRISAHLYNSLDEYADLAEAVSGLVG
jgi:isopenicillin-N epimerase